MCLIKTSSIASGMRVSTSASSRNGKPLGYCMPRLMLVVQAVVQDLPVEVLSRVLRIALEYLFAGWSLYACELTVLRSVCRHWNDVLSEGVPSLFSR
jgi:hypothetical protein